jgi:predicted dehydrogenase
MLKIALVGCGRAAELHAAEILTMRRAQLVAVCDVEPLMAQPFAARHGVPRFYTEFCELLRIERPDVVHITTPPQSHLALVAEAAGAGCHIFLEKPLGLNFAEASRILDCVSTAGVKLTTGYAHKFDPVARMMRQLIADGALGELLHVDSYFGYDLGGAFGASAMADHGHWVHSLPGKLIQNVIDHPLSEIAEFVTDMSPAITVHAYQRRRCAEGQPFSPADFPDELRAMVTGENVTANLTFSSHARPVGHELIVFGTHNTVHVDFVSEVVTFKSPARHRGSVGRLALPFNQARQYLQSGGKNLARFFRSEFYYSAGLNYLMTLFYRSITDGVQVPISYDEMRRISAMADEIVRQLQSASARN